MEETAQKVPVKKKGTEKEPVAQSAEHVLGSLRSEVDRLFDEFSAGWPFFHFRRRILDFEPFRRIEMAAAGRAPVVDVVENDKEYQLTAELPGLEEKDLEVTVSGNLLTIRGTKEEAEEIKESDYFVSERRYGSFERSFPLPASVDRDKIKAKLKSGVLTLALPKLPEAHKKRKKIAVQSS